jgi:hypothetical protein
MDKAGNEQKQKEDMVGWGCQPGQLRWNMPIAGAPSVPLSPLAIRAVLLASLSGHAVSASWDECTALKRQLEQRIQDNACCVHCKSLQANGARLLVGGVLACIVWGLVAAVRCC